MNNRYDAGYGGDQYELVGYDEFGQPVYQQVPPLQQPQPQPQPLRQPQQPPPGQPEQHAYDSYGSQRQAYGYDPYAANGQQQSAPPYGTGRTPPVPPSYGTDQQQPASSYDPYGAGAPGGTATAYDPYGQAAGTGRQPRTAEQTAYVPHQTGRVERSEGGPSQDVGSGAGAPEDPDHRTEQFAFVEEPDGDSEDVIDWLKFTENRTERREAARRRARGRVVALVVVLALVAVSGVGYLWYAGKLPGLSSHAKTGGMTAAGGAQNRDVIVVHLHNTKGGGTSTALLVDNTTTKRGTTVLLPNALAVTDEDGTTTTLAKSVDDDGSSGTLDAIDTVLGTDIEGSWRLDTPYLNNLVELVGNIDINTNANVPDPDAKKKGEAPLVNRGEDQTLSGKMAVAYATYRGSGESQNAQLERFGQVMQGVLRKLSSDPQAATTTVQTLAQILDPPLTDKDLGAFLAKLADHAKGGDYKTELLPVQSNGRLSAQASDSVVKDVLGGSAKSPEKDAAVQVGIQNATGDKDATEQARVVLLNGGYAFVDSGTADAAQAVSRITYADAAKKQDAVEVAKTLGLPTGSVKEGKVVSNADVSVVLGQNYKAGG